MAAMSVTRTSGLEGDSAQRMRVSRVSARRTPRTSVMSTAV